jgi:hypothetical protein
MDETAPAGTGERLSRAPEQSDICPWCSKRMFGEPTALSDGERMHLWCAAEDMDNATFDRDFGDS